MAAVPAARAQITPPVDPPTSNLQFCRGAERASEYLYVGDFYCPAPYARNMSDDEPYVTVSSDALARIVALLRGLAPVLECDPVGRVG
jgi:hypothetical protein